MMRCAAWVLLLATAVVVAAAAGVRADEGEPQLQDQAAPALTPLEPQQQQQLEGEPQQQPQLHQQPAQPHDQLQQHTTDPKLQQLFHESANLLRMRAKLSEDYAHDPSLTHILNNAQRENAIALQRARLLTQHSVSEPMKRMFGFLDAYMPIVPKEHKKRKGHGHGHHVHEHEHEHEKDDDEEEGHDKDEEDEEEKEKEEKEKAEEEEKEEKEEKESGGKKISKKTLAQMEDLLAELMLKREKHPIGTKQRDELDMEIDELLSHIDKAKGGDGHDRHELEKEDDHVKALEKEHANDLLLQKEFEAGLPIDDPNGYVNHHLDKLLQHIQTLRRSPDGLGGLTLQELNDLEVETRALLLDLEEFKGEKVDTRLLKIELDPKLGPLRRQQLLEAEEHKRRVRAHIARLRMHDDLGIEDTTRSALLKEKLAKIEEDTKQIELLHDEHEKVLREAFTASSVAEKLHLEQAAHTIERELTLAKAQLEKDELEVHDVSSRPRSLLHPHSLLHGAVHPHELLLEHDLLRRHHVLPTNAVLGVADNLSLRHINDLASLKILDRSCTTGPCVGNVIEADARLPLPGEPVDGGVQAQTYVDSCGQCHTVFTTCQSRCAIDSCAPDYCQQQLSSCSQTRCSSSVDAVVASVMHPVTAVAACTGISC